MNSYNYLILQTISYEGLDIKPSFTILQPAATMAEARKLQEAHCLISTIAEASYSIITIGETKGNQ